MRFGGLVQMHVSIGEHQEEGRGTEIFDEDFLAGHNLLVLANERFPILQDLLLLGVEDTQSIRVNVACLLGQCDLDILQSGLVCDVDTRGKLLDGLRCSCGGFVS